MDEFDRILYTAHQILLVGRILQDLIRFGVGFMHLDTTFERIKITVLCRFITFALFSFHDYIFSQNLNQYINFISFENT